MTTKDNSNTSGAGLMLGLAAAGLLYFLFRPNKKKSPNSDRRKRVFISFSMKDVRYRDYLVEQAKKSNSPFDFVDMSVKEPWKRNWKKLCRTRIKECDGVIVLLSGKTWSSSGARWEAKCAKEEEIPVVGMRIFKHDQRPIPPELRKSEIVTWSWKNLEKIIGSF